MGGGRDGEREREGGGERPTWSNGSSIHGRDGDGERLALNLNSVWRRGDQNTDLQRAT